LPAATVPANDFPEFPFFPSSSFPEFQGRRPKSSSHFFPEPVMPTSYRAGFPHPFEIPPSLHDLRDELDHLWGNLAAAPPLHGWGARPGSGSFPAVNVRETDDALIVEAELPGLDVGDVEISVAGDELLLKGARPECAAGKHPGGSGNGEKQGKECVTWHRRERGTGVFERRIALPVPVDPSRVDARLTNGVLTVTCPKAPEAQPHKVQVRTA
jgi:HSP20 family protein